jgi:alkylhydroperoxidase family enzyme
LARAPSAIAEDDHRVRRADAVGSDALGEHFSQEQVTELALTIATVNWTNRANGGLQVPLR